MRFFELKKGQAFWFKEVEVSPSTLVLSAGVDGAYGRFVSSYSDPTDPEEWMYCNPVAEVIPQPTVSRVKKPKQLKFKF